MTKAVSLPETLSIHVPFRIVKRGGRKEVQLPPDAPSQQRSRIDNTLVKALSRAFRWQRMLEDGTHATLLDLARAEKINPSYVSRVLRLTLLAPDIIEEILDGRQPERMTLPGLMEPFPSEWEIQENQWPMR